MPVRMRCTAKFSWADTLTEASWSGEWPRRSAPEYWSPESLQLVQMGSGRGGAYTYDWIEYLFGLGMHSADEILPQFQDLEVGDVLPVGPKGPHMRVEVLDSEQAVVFRSEDGNWVWAFALYPEGGNTRLVSRNRIAAPNASFPRRLVNLLVMEPGSVVMEAEC